MHALVCDSCAIGTEGLGCTPPLAQMSSAPKINDYEV